MPTKQTIEEINKIIKSVAGVYGYSHKEILSRVRHKKLVIVRQMLQWLVYNNTGLTMTETAKIFKRDHTSILNSLRSFDKQTGNIKKEAEKMQQLWMEGFAPPPKPKIIKQVILEETPREREARMMKGVDYSQFDIVERARRNPAVRRVM